MTSTTTKSLPLIRSEITFEDAVESDENILQELSYPADRLAFCVYLLDHQKEIEAIVSHHLRLSKSQSYNFCVPVYIDNWSKRVLIRFPLPYKIGETRFPGNADEKLRCEAATFTWIQENCPDVPIRFLWGFGFSDGQSFSALSTAPPYLRWVEYFRRKLLSFLGRPVPCQYIGHRNPRPLKTGYLFMDYIDDSKMLIESWEELRHDQTRRANLFRGLSRIMLSFARVPLPRVLSLSNRPLTLRLHALENEGVPTNIDRDLTYPTVEPFRRRPFLFTLTDLHPSNIFADTDWNIKCLIDLEWACSLPMEMECPPHWLSNRGVDQLTDEYLTEFNELREEFMSAFESEERLLCPADEQALLHTSAMKRGCENGNFWYFSALESTRGLYNIFNQHMRPMFVSSNDTEAETFDRVLSNYWSPKAAKTVAAKLKDKETYKSQLLEVFEAAL
ncbi:hypothetical protein BDY21DRAFT_413954 [Lineolata rhizophorae]|uniref:Aminoglycoside phosphotransferase domain-containing protein n=1 Tax=Lineolata rhizophorae TaxID=578093 RepID=A0A6A6P5V1_9PEZI|nr:hypothetical protein BDY21DRAFT_413954 [Lineolata rhizophorae]